MSACGASTRELAKAFEGKIEVLEIRGDSTTVLREVNDRS